MTQLVLIMYLADILDTITTIAGACVFFSVVACIVSVTGYCLFSWSRYDEMTVNDDYRRAFGLEGDRRFSMACKYKAKFFDHAFKVTLAILIVSSLVRTVLPRERTLYAYMGVEATQQVADKISNDPRMEKIMKIIDAKLDDMVKEKEKNGN